MVHVSKNDGPQSSLLVHNQVAIPTHVRGAAGNKIWASQKSSSGCKGQADKNRKFQLYSARKKLGQL